MNEMDMKVDIKYIKQARADKNWTQQQLADICSLSLRTIQRIEKTGVASHESVASLSSAFEIEKELFISEINQCELLDTKNSALNHIKNKFLTLNIVAIIFLVFGSFGLYNSQLDARNWLLITLIFLGGVLLTFSILKATKSHYGCKCS